jgi:hypothetical protein
MVDVDTGEQPRAMRPLAEHPPAAAPSPPPRNADSKSQAAPDLPAASDTATPVDVDPEPPVASPEESAVTLGTDGVLWLEDSPDDLTSVAEGDGDAKVAPWRQGLRG